MSVEYDKLTEQTAVKVEELISNLNRLAKVVEKLTVATISLTGKVNDLEKKVRENEKGK